ncbi:hypothetical protein A2U01_0061270, partial [Trifolium medium]|nr:hypothetical protein [Trifolium medium]
MNSLGEDLESLGETSSLTLTDSRQMSVWFLTCLANSRWVSPGE